jgi:hypothetical protein
MSEGHPKDIKSNWKGINHNTEREISGAGDTGEYLDGKNGRITSTRGNNMSFEKIRGEEELYSNYVSGAWYCLGSIDVKNQLLEIWVDESSVDDPKITIDGVIVAESPNLPFLIDFPVQMDKNDNCLGGEVFITDNNVPPIIFDVKDMVDSLVDDPTKYFQDFDLSLYSVNLSAPLDIPVFKELVNVGSGGGLQVGQYQYAIRYVNDDGDRTNFGPLTPPIPVVRSLSSSSTQFPSINTFGDSSNILSSTSYGVKLRFRVTNVFNYDFVEIKRLAYNTNSGVDFVPVGQIIAKLEIAPGEISVRDFVDPTESNVTDTLADDEELNDLTSISKAKAIRYHDKRLVLMNIERASKDSDGIVLEQLNGDYIFPILEHIGKAGHSDPVNMTYKRNYTSGERFSFAPVFFDGVGSRGFAVDAPELRNFDIPNRRDPLTSTNSVAWSSSQLPTAANVDSDAVVGKTFEAFDLHLPESKTDTCSFRNILDAGSKNTSPPPAGGGINNLCPPDPDFGSTVTGGELGYRPHTPVGKNDPDVSGHNYRNTVAVDPGDGNFTDYIPKGYSPDYYSKGVAIAGISNIPFWAKSFSIARSRPAGRVICQGLGMYSLEQGAGVPISTALASKVKNELWFYSPDIDSGLTGSGVVEDMISNASEYSIQLISPLGFFSELYGFEENDTLGTEKDKLVDMIAFARVLEDDGSINPGESGVGIDNHVAYNKYRNSASAAGGGVFSGSNGNIEIPLTDFEVVTDNDRGVFYKLTVAPFIYNNGTTNGVGNNNFEDDGLKQWTEPFYMVNIVQDGKTIVDQNIDGYGSTGHYQKIESTIGFSNGDPDQSFILVDERWQDCIPDLSSGGSLAADEVFVYVKGTNGIQKAWMDVTFLTPAQIASIEADIVANGFYLATGGVSVYGLYTHTNTSNREFSIDFNVTGYEPELNATIIVKYDIRRPLIVFGGDSTVSESIFSPIDKNVPDKNDESTQFYFNVGFPFLKFNLNPRIFTVNYTKSTLNKIQDSFECQIGWLRQLAVAFTCETRSTTNLAYNLDGFDQFFPMTNYVMRPNQWSDSDFSTGDPVAIATDNNLFEDYFDDYPEEWTQWVYGGIRYQQNVNLDYAVKGPIEYFSKPDFGFEEKNKFCTAVIWSLARAINQQDSPGLKTFLALNQFDITDDNGEIKLAWDASTAGKGENLYAICESGICLLLTKKAILSNLNGTDLTTLATDSFVSGEYWLSHDVGLNDEMWRGAAEGSIEIPSESGMIKVPGIYLPNKESVYRFYENQIKDIVKQQNYFDEISPYLRNLNTGYDRDVTGFYNSIYNEYWLQLNSTIGTETFTFAQNSDKWQSKFSYRFDQYIQLGDKLLGSRELQTWELDKGFVINGDNIEMFLTQNTTPARGVEMEFIKIQVDSDNKPTKVEFLDEDYNVLCKLDQASKGPLYLKDYSGWEQFIPRKDVGASAERERIQSRLLIYKIFHNLAEDFRVIESVVQFKKIK